MTQPTERSHPNILVALSSHGFGHLSQAAPVVNALQRLIPDARITVRAKLSAERIKRRIHHPAATQPVADDFGMVMNHALSVDVAASLAMYQKVHTNWTERVNRLAQELVEARVDLVLADVPYLTLAAAAVAGIPSVALCSLNWADILEHYIGTDAAPELIGTMRAAYGSARYFLQPTPSMPMPGLSNVRAIGPTCSPGHARRAELLAQIGQTKQANDVAPHPDAWLVLVGMGGTPYELNLEAWPTQIDHRPVYYLVPDSVAHTHPQAVSVLSTGVTYSDLLASVDLIISKPGYGMFVESAAAGVPMLYVARHDWPETDALTAWLQSVGQCREIQSQTLHDGDFASPMQELLRHGNYPPVPPSGNEEAALLIAGLLA